MSVLKLPKKNTISALITLFIAGFILYNQYSSFLISELSPINFFTGNQTINEKNENIKVTPIPEFTDLEIEYINSESGIIEGQIADLALKPLKDVTVFEKYRKITTQTNEKGHYIFENVSPGEVALILTLPNYTSPELGFSIYSGMKLKKNFTMNTIGEKAGGVEGFVRVKGVPQKNVDIFTAVDGKIIKTKTDINGKYVLQNIPPAHSGDDKYRIVASLSNHAPISKNVEVSSGVDTKLDFNFLDKLKGISIFGYITGIQENNSITNIGAKTKPVTYPNATVSITYRNHTSKEYTDSSGFYDTGGDWMILPLPDHINIEVSAPGFKTIHDKISPKQGTSYMRNYTLKKE